METNSNRKQNTLMAILAYIGPLIIISYIIAKDDAFVKFHIKQGLLLVIASAITWILSNSFWQFWMIINFVNLAIFVLAVIGILNVLRGEQKQLPLIGHLASSFKF